MTPPDVFDHTDFRRYLDAWFRWRKASNPRYSHRGFARRVGSTDPSLLVNIVKGRRRLPDRLLPGFVTALELQGDAEEMFRILVRLGQAAGAREEERAWAELSALRSRLRKPEIDGDRLRYFSQPVYPTIRSLTECEGFDADPAWVGAHLRPPISAEAAADAIALLERLGFLARDGDRLVVVEPTVRTDTTVENLGTLEFHAHNLAYASEVLDEVRSCDPDEDESAFLGATVVVPTERLVELRSLLYEHLGQILHQCEAWPHADRVAQINVQMFPVTRSSRS